ncbi:hypothetical protein M1D46_00335 [Microbacterium sp. JZ70]
MHSIPRTRRLGGALVLIATLALTGCTEPEHALATKPSPTPTTDPRDQALTAVNAYLDVFSAVAADAGEQPERLATVASGPALDDALQAAESWRRLGIFWEGRDEFSPTHYDIGTTAAVTGCRDTSDMVPNALDGEDVSTSGDTHFTTTYHLELDATETWKVTTITSNAGCDAD